MHSFETRFFTAIVRKTNVISVNLLAESPGLAQRKCSFCRQIILPNTGGCSALPASKFFATETERIREEWNNANRQLADFQQQHQLLSLPDRESAIDDQIVEGEHDLLTSEINFRELDRDCPRVRAIEKCPHARTPRTR